MIPLWAALLGCGPASAPVEPQVTVRAWATDLTASGGLLVVQTSAPPSTSFELPAPQVEGLTFSPEPPLTERLGDRSVITQRWRFTGKKGSYEIPALEVAIDGAEPIHSLPLWVDLGVEVSDFTQMADIEDPAPVWTLPWRGVAAVAVGSSLVAGLLGVTVFALARPRTREVEVEPADLRCLRAWEAVRADPSLSDEQKALELSRLFREYTEQVLGFPAVSWTTSEILAHLDAMVHLPKGNVPRAKNLLRATDLVKYAEVSPETDFFEALDADLRAFVGTTRPAAWSAEPPPPPEVPRG